MTERQLKKIPYGISNYNLFCEEQYYYVDKTHYIRNIEDKGRCLFFFRPRRFGKSLFLSTLETYYDINWRERFDFFFQGTAIRKTPTSAKSSYMILKLDFSAVDSDISLVEDAFFNHVKNAACFFLDRYSELLEIDCEKSKRGFDSLKSPSTLMDTLLNYCKGKSQKIYIIIDEYDNFANTILSTSGEKEYMNITHGEGFLRTFFNVLKSGTSGSQAPISRLFMTGVSPITLDDVTSGFNIAQNISLDEDINEILGFTRAEVETMIEYYREAGKIRHTTGELLEIMTNWYNSYRFTSEQNAGIFNSSLVLYFLNEYLKSFKIPQELIDRNVRIDYHKVRHLIVVDRKGRTDSKQTSQLLQTQIPKINGNFSKLTSIIENGFVQSLLVKGFPIAELTGTENFISLLFYFGLLTISGITLSGQSVLTIPNETVKQLYYDYIKETYKETQLFSLDFENFSKAMEEMAFAGRWLSLIDYLAQRMESSIGLRDLINREKAVQAFLNVYLGLSPLYIVHSEKELNKGFADLVLEPFLARFPAIKYSFLIEIKYLKADSFKKKFDEEKIKKIREEAESQLKKYSLDEKFQKTIGKTNLIKLVLIFCGHRLIYKGEVD